jgi:hypothetical protein
MGYPLSMSIHVNSNGMATCFPLDSIHLSHAFETAVSGAAFTTRLWHQLRRQGWQDCPLATEGQLDSNIKVVGLQPYTLL